MELQSNDADPTPSKKLASKIVTPSHENVTIHNKSATRSLTFSPNSSSVPKSQPAYAMIIGALNDMELTEQIVVADQEDGGFVDGDVNMNDLLGEDLMEMEQGCLLKVPQEKRSAGKGRNIKRSSSDRVNHKKSAPLGTHHKKFELLRRGSPRQRSVTQSIPPPHKGDANSRNATKKESGFVQSPNMMV